MDKQPEIGGLYWYVDELWGVLVAIPVKLASFDAEQGFYTGIWELGEGFTEEINRLKASELYTSEREAQEAIKTIKEREAQP